MEKKQSITAFLTDHAKRRPVSFHMPGHKGADIYRENGYGVFLDSFMDCDITEIPGADNLFQPEEIIAEAMARYRELYQVKESYLLINGSSTGLIAAIMTAVKPGGKLIMARNCHKAIFNGISMIGGQPVYAYPQMIEKYGISGEITAEEIARCLQEHPDSDAVILPSPNYYGICSDIEAIASVVHGAGKILIVDQAHGAHLKFFDAWVGDKPKAAENLGADIVINSTHKTLASMTQTAIANLCTERIDKYTFEDKLQLIESTSPSYILMGSLDINADLLEHHGRELLEAWEENLQYFYREAAKISGLQVIQHPMLDHAKINLDMEDCGVDGLQLEELLMDRNIFVELVTGNIVMCMTGIGNKRLDYERLLEALREVSRQLKLQHEADGTPYISKENEKDQTSCGKNTTFALVSGKKLEQRPIPIEKERILLKEAAGRICASSIIPYPPGIPMICPGEVIDEEVLEYVIALRQKGEKVMGIDDLGRVVVGKTSSR